MGDFIRKRRQELGISQQKLGLLLQPPVTTQFMSNIERGITPLPLRHISSLAKALECSEQELTELLQRELKMKFMGKLGGMSFLDSQSAETARTKEIDLFNRIYSAYLLADSVTQKAFTQVTAVLLKIKNISGE